jgi:hypothetical protein
LIVKSCKILGFENMSTSPQSQQSQIPLAAFAGFVGVISIFLYYSGWIYRWSYFRSFAIDVTSLGLPTESFLLVTIQVFLGDFGKFALFFVLALGTISLIRLTLLCVEGSIPDRPWWQPLRLIRLTTRLLPPDILRDLVIVSWILVSLFFFSKHQGIADAHRDAVNSSSTRPAVTLVGSATKLPIGRNPRAPNDDVFDPKEVRIFGDGKTLEAIIGRESDDPDAPDNGKRIWRLLAETSGWVYLFPSTDNLKANQFPRVVSINTGEGRVQLLILSHPDQTSTVSK